MTNVLFVTESHLATAGGVTTVVDQLAQAVVRHGGRARVIAAGGDDRATAESDQPYVTRLRVPVVTGAWMWSPGLNREIGRWVAELPARVLHLHGIWMAPQACGAVLARRVGAATILTLHGMMEPWHWDERGLVQRIRKSLYWYVVGRAAFRSVTVIHAITTVERDHLRKYFPRQRIEVIPNGINLRQPEQNHVGNDLTHERYLLFLGRLHAKKGIELLINAFARSRVHRKVRLVLAGTGDDPSYEVTLKKLAERSGAAQRIDFVGAVYGDRKWALLSDAWALVAPSYSEVMGMVNLEAASCNVPTLTTYETGLDAWGEGGGILVHPVEHELVRALEQVCAWSDQERNDRGRAIRRHVEMNYSWDVIWPRWMGLYSELERAG